MSIQAEQEIKALKSRIKKLCADIALETQTVAEQQKQLHRQQTNLSNLKDQLEALEEKNKELSVTEHAIVRYFERVLGFDLEEIESKILTPTVCGLHEKLGNGKIPLSDGCRVVIKNNTVVTIE